MKKLLLAVSMAVSIASPAALAVETTDSRYQDPENSERYSPGYSYGHEYGLKNEAKDVFPTERFYLQVSRDTKIAHLLLRHKPEAIPSRPLPSDPPTLEDSISIFKSSSGWSKLTLDDASKIFGKPRKKINEESIFYTFDVSSSEPYMEKQLYHIDMKFGTGSVATAYRLRGIGIPNPQWIDK